jgi:hypothetical protein
MEVNLRKVFVTLAAMSMMCIAPGYGLRAQETGTASLTPQERGGKWGYVDENGKEVIPFKYIEAKPFSEGLALIREYDNYGFIDSTGQVVIPSVLRYVGKVIMNVNSFSEGLALIGTYIGPGIPLGGYTFIDKTGQRVLKAYFDARSFSEGLARVNISSFHPRWGVIDKTGKEVTRCKYAYIRPFSEGLAVVALYKRAARRIIEYVPVKWGFIDKTGQEVFPENEYEDIKDFSEGKAAVVLNGKWGFIDKSGQEVIPCMYDYVLSFSNGKACVNSGGKWMMQEDYSYSAYNDDKYHLYNMYYVYHVCFGGRWGFIDEQGNEAIPVKYDWVEPFRDGLAAVGLDGKSGYIDMSGQEVIPLLYDGTKRFSDGMICVFSGCDSVKTGYFKDEHFETSYFGGKCGLIDTTGREVIPCKYDWINPFPFNSDIYTVRLDGKYGFINRKTGQEIVQCKYDSVEFVLKEGLVKVGSICDSVLVLKEGKEGQEGLVKVRSIRFISTHIPPYTVWVLMKGEKGKKVKKGWGEVGLIGWGYIDRTCQEVVPCKYPVAGEFSKGLAQVASTTFKWGLIDGSGQEVIPCKYDEKIQLPKNGLARVRSGGKWGFIDKTGQEIIPCIYDKAKNFRKGKAKVRLNGKKLTVDETGNEIK